MSLRPPQSPALLTTLLLLVIGGVGWYWNVHGFKRNITMVIPLIIASPTTATLRPQQTPTATPTTTSSASSTLAPSSETAIAPAPLPATTIADPANTPTFTATVAAKSGVDLRILDEGLTTDTYSLEGAAISQFAVGADLVVYTEPNPGVEVAIALLKVIGQSPTSLTAQAILIDPENPIRTRMRVDGNLGFLSTSQLVPVFDYAAGYLFRTGRVRLRPDHELTIGTQLQALLFERISGEIIDALRTDTIMEITDIGASNIVAAVELTTGTWPVTGTIVSQVEFELLPTPTVVESPTATPTVTSVVTPTATRRPPPTKPDLDIKGAGTVSTLQLRPPETSGP